MIYNVLHDASTILCFVGQSKLSKSCYLSVKQHRPAEIYSYEEVLTKSHSWIAKRQFIVLTSDIAFKIKCLDALTEKQAKFFSLVSTSNITVPDTIIGAGTYIGGFNEMGMSGVTIGSHVIVGTHNTFGHNSTIGNLSHISHHSFFNDCCLGQGVVCGTRITVLAKYSQPQKITSIADFSNIISESRVLSNITKAGTYYNNRQIGNGTSLTERIL